MPSLGLNSQSSCPSLPEYWDYKYHLTWLEATIKEVKNTTQLKKAKIYKELLKSNKQQLNLKMVQMSKQTFHQRFTNGKWAGEKMPQLCTRAAVRTLVSAAACLPRAARARTPPHHIRGSLVTRAQPAAGVSNSHSRGHLVAHPLPTTQDGLPCLFPGDLRPCAHTQPDPVLTE